MGIFANQLPRLFVFLILLRQTSGLNLKKGLSDKRCIEDMCIPSELQRIRATDIKDKFVDPKPARTIPCCSANEPLDKRLLLLTLAAPSHGSTALEGVLMSSRNVTTLCPYKGWQCEGNEIMKDHGYDRDSLEKWNFTEMLSLYSDVWDLTKPIFLEKTPNQYYFVEHENKGIHTAQIPQALRNLNVTKLGVIYILLWRPLCLGKLSSHFQDYLYELNVMKYQVEGHKYLLKRGEPVIVVNFADLIWKPYYTQKRLETSLPCLGKLNMDYVPQLGKEVFIENGWKADTSVRRFGASADPAMCCNYSMVTSKCGAKFLDDLPREDFRRYATYANYLQSHSF